MRIALIGYGKMGKAIEKVALSRGHEIICVIDVANQADFDSDAFRGADIAIEFSTPSTAYDNYIKAFAQGVGVVSGSTGWLDKIEDIKLRCDNGATFFYASNFSIGANIFFAVNSYLAKIMNGYNQYDVDMTEVHHIHKLDHPSGTAITLAEDIIENINRKNCWTESETPKADEIKITSERLGELPGTHTIRYTSNIDAITIEHEAFSREGLALGAVVAAEWMNGKKGFYTMDRMMNINGI